MQLIRIKIVHRLTHFNPAIKFIRFSDLFNAKFSLYMTDAAPEQFAAFHVTIDEVWVHRAETGEAAEDVNGGSGVPPGGPETDGGWERVASPERTYNLLSLVNGALAELGTMDLPS